MQPSHMLSHSQAFPEMITNQENTALKAECTAVQNAYNTLVSRLTLNQLDQSVSSDRILNISLTLPLITTMPLLNVPPILQLNQANYPKTTWTLMLLQVKKAFHGELIQAVPELNFCEDLWKSNLLAKKHYLSFKQTWFMNRMDEKTNSATKHKTKSEVVEDTDLPTGVRNVKHRKTDIFTAPKNSNDDSLQVDSANMSSVPVIPVVPTPNTVEQEDTGISVAAWLIKNPLSSLCPPPVVRDSPELTMTISESVRLNENSNSSNECMSAIDKGGSQVKAPSTSVTSSILQPSVQQMAPQPTDGMKKKKQVSGSLKEFNKYFDELPSEAKAKYKDEVNDLVECKVWINGMAAIVAKFSGEQEQQGEGSVDKRECRQCKGRTIKQNKR
ncbi:hypothetical protein BKA82DRAFT_10045 [Pisolithus tinctorius]|uniref:Uncharacterized protein n=1 Tax=Pisolithus tinctorius Marx 270 TaxID=870435 RepID=A0A0C3IWI6_PISTI|nr:hypothetical protein BKA82DRAFT_10045 [Pisolithus tinctorius]KIO01193.1 hypothetical protein M404DRAFT_10045 [Pisolithus tinctorius Marx 270]